MSTTTNFVTVDNIPYYKISDAQKLTPFFIQVASSCDLWLFMSSNGGVTAGRKNSKGNIFPYDTDDKLHGDTITGSKTVIKVGETFWQPFESNGVQKYKITRNIYKGYYGDSIMMEEVNHDLGLTYSYKFESSEQHGIVKTSKFTNHSGSDLAIEVLDGLSNILPAQVNELLQWTISTLVDSYKAAELEGNNLGIYSLTTKVNDTPNPVEVLHANIAYTTLSNAKVYLSANAMKHFYDGTLDTLAGDAYGKKSAYFVHFVETLTSSVSHTYSFVLDSAYDHDQISKVNTFIEKGDFSSIFEDISMGTKHLKEIVGNADGLQETGDEVACSAHYLNTLYNVMRGGTFENGYDFSYEDFIQFISVRNKKACENTGLLEKIKGCTTVHELKEVASCDNTMYRLALEYMPLSFSRRHGDPSRPWNKFNIALKDEHGNRVSSYEGNWRDIFQNWEALGLSFPCYYENMMTKFVNASTADGFNPYRINAQGIDWEKPEEDNPFGGFGYWGDHQIIYLLRLLKGMSEHFPVQVDKFLSLDAFTYANIPYVIKPYDEILKDSKDTITFDFAKDDLVESLCTTMGSDGKLVLKSGEVYTVNLTEKLLVPLLSKMSNLLIGGGIWMNTQRPEWNDANNAIVGIGLSMVTVYHVKAYLEFVKELLAKQSGDFAISTEVAAWMANITKSISGFIGNYNGNEKNILDDMGVAFSEYRMNLYKNEFSGKVNIKLSELISSLDVYIDAIDYTISANKGSVYSTYNLLTDEFEAVPMQAMLEGQSAVIGSGCLSADEVCSLLVAMEDELLDKKLGCHTLYPVNKTTRFVNKNTLNTSAPIVEGITYKDDAGVVRFAPKFTTEEELVTALETVSVSDSEKSTLLASYEEVFSHKKFTGRSQVMYKFEGIGCVYWHQNAKLALAVLESVERARSNGENADKIYAAYKEVMQGFIYRKTPEQCNAIPVEPYSHTSFNHTSEQPGMTGQVKESVIMRRLELGVNVVDGCITFDSWFVSPDEFDGNGEVNFTIYGVPTKYVAGSGCNGKITVTYKDGSKKVFEGALDTQTSMDVFMRNGTVVEILA